MRLPDNVAAEVTPGLWLRLRAERRFARERVDPTEVGETSEVRRAWAVASLPERQSSNEVTPRVFIWCGLLGLGLLTQIKFCCVPC
ncbi:hypothetical protein ADL29_18280 [Streptomyces chattanoogensis]|uniref:Uncharacterized protein n=1 Tax=Streptomyces chattanoogensis TaxID=66876 RepID=A0A0N1JXW9_9ACTN|nr:hypothetical protein ADL29_18280 [Streptomyces chattanoogensis]